jgi:hypothetical protein
MVRKIWYFFKSIFYESGCNYVFFLRCLQWRSLLEYLHLSMTEEGKILFLTRDMLGAQGCP